MIQTHTCFAFVTLVAFESPSSKLSRACLVSLECVPEWFSHFNLHLSRVLTLFRALNCVCIRERHDDDSDNFNGN